MRAQYLEHQLRDRSARRPTYGVDARTRFAIRTDRRLADLGERTQVDLLRAIGSVGHSLQGALLVVVRDPRFQRLSDAVHRSLLSAAAVAESVEELAALHALIAAPSFDRLGDATQVAIGRMLERSRFDGSRAARALASSSAFGELDPAERVELLRWAGGPARPHEAVRGHWRRARAELTDRLAELDAMDPRLGAEILRDFLHAPDCAVCFVRESKQKGHRSVVFGEVSARGVLSYGQVGSGFVERPDPKIEEITRSDIVSAPTVRVERAMVTRAEEQQLIERLESAPWLVDRSAPPSDVFADARRTLEILAAARRGLEIETTYMAGGLVWVDQSDCDELLLIDRLISEYMAGAPISARAP
jgi:hypothetical protein